MRSKVTVYRTTQNEKKEKITKNEKPLNRVIAVQYSRAENAVQVGASGLWWKRFVEKVSFEPGMKQ